MARPNPFRDPLPFNRVRLGGVLVQALLIKWDGLKLEDGWKSDKSKTTSGHVAKFTGTKPVGGEKGFTLTFKAYDQASYDATRALFDLLAPIPGQGGGTSVTAATGTTTAVGSAAAGAQYTGGASGTATTTTAASSSGTLPKGQFGAASSQATTPDPDPGPRPPTLPIEFAPCAEIGVFAVARASWEAKHNEDRSWDIEVGLIQDKPPVPAGSGAMGPAAPANPGAQYASTGGSAGADPTKAAAAAQAQGT
jgi:hypothetical protein